MPPRRTSLDSVKFHAGALVEEPAVGILTEEDERSADSLQPTESFPDSSAADILADLDALQREVDALRGQLGKEAAA